MSEHVHYLRTKEADLKDKHKRAKDALDSATKKPNTPKDEGIGILGSLLVLLIFIILPTILFAKSDIDVTESANKIEDKVSQEANQVKNELTNTIQLEDKQINNQQTIEQTLENKQKEQKIAEFFSNLEERRENQ